MQNIRKILSAVFSNFVLRTDGLTHNTEFIVESRYVTFSPLGMANKAEALPYTRQLIKPELLLNVPYHTGP